MNSSYPTTNGRTCTHHTLQWTLGHALIIHYNGRQDIKSSYTTTDVTVGHALIIHYNGQQDMKSSYTTMDGRTRAHHTVHYNGRQDMKTSDTTTDGRTCAHHTLHRMVGHPIIMHYNGRQDMNCGGTTHHIKHYNRRQYMNSQKGLYILKGQWEKNIFIYKGRQKNTFQTTRTRILLITKGEGQDPTKPKRM